MKGEEFESPTKLKNFTGIMTPPVIKNTNPKIKSQWNRLYVNRHGRMHSPQQAIREVKKVKTESVEMVTYFCNLNPHDVQHQKARKMREVTRERIRKNEEIFYQKRHYSEKCSEYQQSIDKSPGNGSVSEFNLPRSQSNKSEINKPVCAKEKTLPFMLQRRRKKMDKELSIIEHLLIEDIRKIKGREEKKQQLNQQERMKLLSRMKGTKIYYNFVREWKTPVFQDQQQVSQNQEI